MKKIDFNILNILSNKSERTILFICISVAFVFWIFSKLSRDYNSALTVDLDFQLPNQNSILTKTPPRSLDVTLGGNGWDLMFQSMRRRKPKLDYQLNQDSAQVFRLQRLTRDLQIRLGSEVEIGTINPEVIELDLDVKATKRIPIRLVNEISIAPQFTETAQKTIRPDTIEVTGPSSVIRNIKEWQTTPLAFENLNRRVTDTISIEPFPNRQVSFEPTYVAYDVITEQITEKTLEIPIKPLGDNKNIIFHPTTIKVQCTLGLSNYDRLTPAQFNLIIDLSQGNNGFAPIIIQKKPSFLKTVEYEYDTIQYFKVVE